MNNSPSDMNNGIDGIDNPTESIVVSDAMRLIEQRVNADQSLINSAIDLTTVAMLHIGGQQWQLTIHSGRIQSLTTGPFVMPSSDFQLSAPETEWQKFWLPVPPPGSHDLFALLKRRMLTISGNLHPFMAYLLYFKFVLAAPRTRATS